MADFHRLNIPTYDGGLPATHDLLNDPGAATQGGHTQLVGKLPAPADVQKADVSHPNQGTYFVAFGEDGTSSDANRGFSAFGDNTDFLDDAIHRELAVPAITAELIGGPTPSIVLVGEVFVGEPGATPDLRTITGLISVVDDLGVALHVDTGGGTYSAVEVVAIEDGGFNLVGVTDPPFFTDPTVFFNIPVPEFQKYRLVYTARGNLLTQTVAAFTRERQGNRSPAELWAFAKTTREGPITFTGDKTFTDNAVFNGIANFNDTVTVDAPININEALTVSALPALFNVDTTFNQKIVRGAADPEQRWLESLVVSDATILGTFRVATGPDRFMRLYAVDSTLVGQGGLMITNNVRFDVGAGPGDEWVIDDAGAQVSRCFISEDGLIIQGFQTNPASPFGSTDWTTADSRNGLVVRTGTNQVEIENSFLTLPAEVEQLPLDGHDIPNIDIDGVPDFPSGSDSFNLLFQAVLDPNTGIKIRFYASSNNSFPTGLFCVTYNARYDEAGPSEFVADDNTEAALCLSFNSVGDEAEIGVTHKQNTSAPWSSASGWDGVPTGGPSLREGSDGGNVSISGDYRYRGVSASGVGTRQRTTSIDLSNPIKGHLVTGEVGWEAIGIGQPFGVARNVVGGPNTARVIIRLPDGATWTNMSVKYFSSSGTIKFELFKLDFDMATAAANPVASSLGTAVTPPPTGLSDVVSVPTGGELIDNTQFVYYLEMISATATDAAKGAIIVWEDPGPRNY